MVFCSIELKSGQNFGIGTAVTLMAKKSKFENQIAEF